MSFKYTLEDKGTCFISGCIRDERKSEKQSSTSDRENLDDAYSSLDQIKQFTELNMYYKSVFLEKLKLSKQVVLFIGKNGCPSLQTVCLLL